MTDFGELRDQLANSRAQRDVATARLAALRAQLKQVQGSIAQLTRVADKTESSREQLTVLQRQAQSLSSQVEGQRTVVSGLRATLTQVLGQLTALGDPAQQIEQLDDAIPILLFPIRLEVRFHAAGPAGDSSRPQLWIRIFPDDCQIDGFEALFTDSEVQNITSFWIAMWRAGGIEAQERGAWRSLLGGAGSGRAAYLIGQYSPTNPSDKPNKVQPQDVILVVVPKIDVSNAEKALAVAYWTAIWKANGEHARSDAAFTTLAGALGNARAKAIIDGFAPDPTGWDPPKPYTRDQVTMAITVLELPPPPVTKQASWTQSPKAVGLPDRFVALAYSGGVEVKRAFGNPITDQLSVAPDPSLPAGDQIKVTDQDLQLDDDLKWLADFDRAVTVGMGIKIDLTPDEAQTGFDRLLVMGVRASSDEKASQQLLETLISHQYASKGGYSLVPQGSATNNTDSGGTAFSWVDDPDASYDSVLKGKDAYVDSAEPLERRDGQWLAEALGVDASLMRRLPDAGGVDQREARAMNIALWNGTLGYMLEEMLPPLFSRADIATTRQFFTRYVSGRGPLPAIRVGKQPYGVLPAMAFSRYSATPPQRGRIEGPAAGGRPTADYLQRLHTLLARLDADWRDMANTVARVGQPGDPHQTLLDIVGLHSGAVEFHQRYSESLDQLYNTLALELGDFVGALVAAALEQRSQDLLTQLGADPNAKPPILEKFFFGDSALLTGPLIDDPPLSETTPIQAYTPDGKNYIEWLASASLDTIRTQDFGGNPQPTALLYLLLRHSMMLGHWDAGLRLLESHALVDPSAARLEPSFINVQTPAPAIQSKFERLYEPQPAVTGDTTTLLADYVRSTPVLDFAAETVDLRDTIGALDTLARTPTARLERVFAEHVDCCSYRLDAWKTGLVATRLAEMRDPGGAGKARQGIYLGAFGWLEDVRPKQTPLTPVRLQGDLATTFQRPTDAPLAHDPQNAGFVHAPSINQAAAAAILKNAYRVNASPANPDAMAVNLSSNRVRQALAILEGVRNGQTLSALLGYRFERGLHDEHALAEVDKFIYPLRQAFPLVANQLKDTQTDGTVDITLLEARNVIDGMALVNRLRTDGNATYPFGIAVGGEPGQVPVATAQEQEAINTEANRLSDLYDALGDLVMAESVYQVVLGNFDRASANTKAFNQGGHPPQTQIVDTPRTGLSLTHRVAVHLDPTVAPDASPSPVPLTVPMTPRAKAEAPLNQWLAARMPPPADVVVNVSYSTPAAPATVVISLEALSLQPIDLLYLFNLDLDQGMAELDDRIVQHIRYEVDHPDVVVTIHYTDQVPGKVTFFELASLIRSLRAVVLKSRSLGPNDLAMPLESKSDDAVWDDAEFTGRVNAAIFAATGQRDALIALESDLSDLDTYAKLASTRLLETALFGIPQTGTGQIHADIRAIYDAIILKLRAFVTRWTKNVTDYAGLMAVWPTLTSDEDRFGLLKRAERLVAAQTTSQPPASPANYKAAIDTTKAQFDAHLSQLEAFLSWNGSKLVDFAAAVGAFVPVAAQHDAIPLDIGDQLSAMPALRATIVARVTGLANDLTQRIGDATNSVTAAANVTSSQERVQKLVAAGKLVLGDEAQLVPRFRLSAGHAAEFTNAWSSATALLAGLKADGRRFPVDDWLYGVARVREKLNAWENVIILSEAFGATAPELTPIQLPFIAGDRWTALEFDAVAATRNNRLLYTAHFEKPFDAANDQCGLIVDDWPELVPDADIVSGVTFHFDRPSSQPPQAILLAVPPTLRGSWQWDDLVATIGETLDGAKSRGVEPTEIDSTKYAQFIPATLMAVTLYQITIATNLALSNRVYDLIGKQ